MSHISGKAVIAIALSTFLLTAGLIFVVQGIDPSRGLIESSALERSGIKDLNVEYLDGKIYLNVELNTPKTCAELVHSLRIQPLVIKTRTYNPACSKISDTLMRITYTQSIIV